MRKISTITALLSLCTLAFIFSHPAFAGSSCKDTDPGNEPVSLSESLYGDAARAIDAALVEVGYLKLDADRGRSLGSGAHLTNVIYCCANDGGVYECGIKAGEFSKPVIYKKKKATILASVFKNEFRDIRDDNNFEFCSDGARANKYLQNLQCQDVGFGRACSYFTTIIPNVGP